MVTPSTPFALFSLSKRLKIRNIIKLRNTHILITWVSIFLLIILSINALTDIPVFEKIYMAKKAITGNSNPAKKPVIN